MLHPLVADPRKFSVVSKCSRLAVLLLLLPTPALTQGRVLEPSDLPLRRAGAALLEEAIKADRDTRQAPAASRLGALQGAVAKAATTLPAGSQARWRLEQALAASRDPGAGRAEVACRSLGSDTADILAELRFRPFVEAELPEGFPTFAAVDELEIRRYPTYRMVRTKMRPGADMGAFWTLFNHIKDRDIAMTTPVQMDYTGSGDEGRQSSMAFLYGRPELGPAGPAGRAEVVDVEAMTVVSIGARGRERDSRVDELRERLEEWLLSQEHYVASGPVRLLTHNSPMVRTDRRFFEVQIPIRSMHGVVEREQAGKISGTESESGAGRKISR